MTSTNVFISIHSNYLWFSILSRWRFCLFPLLCLDWKCKVSTCLSEQMINFTISSLWGLSILKVIGSILLFAIVWKCNWIFFAQFRTRNALVVTGLVVVCHAVKFLGPFFVFVNAELFIWRWVETSNIGTTSPIVLWGTTWTTDDDYDQNDESKDED